MRQRILGSHTPPCHRRMVITTQFSVLPCCTAAQTSSVPLQVAFEGGGGGGHSLHRHKRQGRLAAQCIPTLLGVRTTAYGMRDPVHTIHLQCVAQFYQQLPSIHTAHRICKILCHCSNVHDWSPHRPCATPTSESDSSPEQSNHGGVCAQRAWRAHYRGEIRDFCYYWQYSCLCGPYYTPTMLHNLILHPKTPLSHPRPRIATCRPRR